MFTISLSYCPQNDETNNNDSSELVDLEDIGPKSTSSQSKLPLVTKRKSGAFENSLSSIPESPDTDFSKSWKDVLGSPPSLGETKVGYGI